MLLWTIVIVAVVIILSMLTVILIQNSVIKKLQKRKTKASQELIDRVEQEMMKAIKYHNVQKYYFYRNIFNDLVPEEEKQYMY